MADDVIDVDAIPDEENDMGDWTPEEREAWRRAEQRARWVIQKRIWEDQRKDSRHRQYYKGYLKFMRKNHPLKTWGRHPYWSEERLSKAWTRKRNQWQDRFNRILDDEGFVDLQAYPIRHRQHRFF